MLSDFFVMLFFYCISPIKVPLNKMSLSLQIMHDTTVLITASGFVSLASLSKNLKISKKFAIHQTNDPRVSFKSCVACMR